MSEATTIEPKPLPPGEYAIVEMLGHRTIIGRWREIERFGTKMLAIEPVFQGKLLDAILVAGASLYAFTPCTAETALKHSPTSRYELPTVLAMTMPEDDITGRIEFVSGSGENAVAGEFTIEGNEIDLDGFQEEDENPLNDPGPLPRDEPAPPPMPADEDEIYF